MDASATNQLQPLPVAAGDAACWNSIGVRGDHSCPKLKEQVHCRNCPVYRSAAARLLDRPSPAGYVDEATELFAQLKTTERQRTQSAVVFRIAGEWLALATAMVVEIAAARAIHSLPHRRGGAVLGIANVRGQVLVCVSLARLLGVQDLAESRTAAGGAAGRLMVVAHREGRIAFPVEEVHGVLRFHPDETKEVPASVARASAAHTQAMLTWGERAVGWLDEKRIFAAVTRSLA